jgi:hypothetical protein
MMTHHQAKHHLKTLGYAQRKVAPLLGVTYEHLNRVLNGHLKSRSLLERISNLPPQKKFSEKKSNPRFCVNQKSGTASAKISTGGGIGRD